MHPSILFTALLSGPLLAAAPSAALAQHAAHQPAAPEWASPYAGMQGRDIKALSPQQIADLREGKGMALALAGELNGFPGPSHVLEMADALGLSAEQRATTQQLLEQMKTQARTLGAEVIAAEGRLDALFKERRVTRDNLMTATLQVANAQGRLRAAHLGYHLTMAELLTAGQIEIYNQLRGY